MAPWENPEMMKVEEELRMPKPHVVNNRYRSLFPDNRRLMVVSGS